MDERQLKKMLRGAVLGVLPAAMLTMSCGGLCIPTPQTTRANAEVSFSHIINEDVDIPDFEACAKQCKELVLAREKANNYITTIDGFKATSCEVTSDNQEGKLLSCDASFTKVKESTNYVGTGCPVAGRIPKGMALHHQGNTDEVGHYFAEIASLEAAAVTAFAYLVKELEAYDAPQSFIDIAKDAIREETEHAELTAMLATSYGATPWEVSVPPFALRPIDEIAIENATEGCVRETFASACAMWQALHADTAAVRMVMERIAVEESRHAALSWQIDEWLMAQLTPAQQERCREAKRATIAELEASFTEATSPRLQAAAGLPDTNTSAKLFGQLRETLWV